MNKAILLGRLGQDPELRHTQSQTAVCSFSIATTKKIKGEEKTVWHSITAWGKLAEICAKYLTKGRQVVVEGEIDLQTWEGDDGQKKYKTIINANNIEFVGENANKDKSEDQGYMPKPSAGLDDIPF